MSVKRALQIESDVVTSRSVVIPFEFKPETIPAGKNVGDSIVITPITVRTGFRIRPFSCGLTRRTRMLSWLIRMLRLIVYCRS